MRTEVRGLPAIRLAAIAIVVVGTMAAFDCSTPGSRARASTAQSVAPDPCPGAVQDCPDPQLMSKAIPGWSQAVQDKLSPYADKVASVLSRDGEFAMTQLNYQQYSVEVYYAGDSLPDSIDQIRSAAVKDGVTLVLKHVRFPTSALDDATKKLEAAAASEGVAWTDTEEMTPVGGLNAGLTIWGSQSQESLDSRIQPIAAKVIPGIPVVVVESEGSPQLNYSRQSDGSPWSGSARVRSSGGGCSSGLGATSAPSTTMSTPPPTARFPVERAAVDGEHTDVQEPGGDQHSADKVAGPFGPAELPPVRPWPGDVR